MLAKLYATALALSKVGGENEDGLPELPEAALANAKANLACFNARYHRSTPKEEF